MNERLELLGIMIPTEDKRFIREMATRNRLTMSDVARMLISDSSEHISEREILKLVA